MVNKDEPSNLRQIHVRQQPLNRAMTWMPIDTKEVATIDLLRVSWWQLLCQTDCCIAPDSGWLHFAY